MNDQDRATDTPESSANRGKDRGYSRWKRDAAIAGGVAVTSALLMAVAGFAMGRVGDNEARILVESILPTSRFLCSSIMTAAATILALMLTLLGTTVNASTNLDAIFYHRIKQVAFYDMLVLAGATTFLIVHCIPITKSDELPGWWYPSVYYSLLFFSAVLGGAMVGIVGMLYAAVRDVIDVLGLDDQDHEIVRKDQDG